MAHGNNAAGLRLACLHAAIEIRSPGTGHEDLLATATLFHEFVTAAPAEAARGNAPRVNAAHHNAAHDNRTHGDRPADRNRAGRHSANHRRS
jgi:hypothetical protein